MTDDNGVCPESPLERRGISSVVESSQSRVQCGRLTLPHLLPLLLIFLESALRLAI